MISRTIFVWFLNRYKRIFLFNRYFVLLHEVLFSANLVCHLLRITRKIAWKKTHTKIKGNIYHFIIHLKMYSKSISSSLVWKFNLFHFSGQTALQDLTMESITLEEQKREKVPRISGQEALILLGLAKTRIANKNDLVNKRNIFM